MSKNVFLNKGLAVMCGLFLFAGSLFAQTEQGVYSTTELVTSNQTVTIPSNAISVTFEAWGAGGAGGYVNQSLLNVAAGGGGGAYAKKVLTYPNIASEYQVTVGEGGKHVITKNWRGQITSATSTDGGSSFVTASNSNTKLVEAVGGKTVRNGSREAALGGAASECTGDVAFSGGRGGNAPVDAFVDEWFSGGGGGAAGVDANGGDARDAAFLVSPLKGLGGAGNPVSGDGGEPQTLLRAGNAGVLYGGGGSGAQASADAKNGGPGANGVVRVTIVTSTPEEFECGMSKVSDGYQAYKTIDMNGVCWMRENLQTNLEGSSYYNDDPNSNLMFGRLYTWEAASNACPAGWALPTAAQIEAIYAFGEDAIKSDNPDAWTSNLLGTNETGFAAMGAGKYSAAAGQYQKLRGYTAFWTSDGTESPSMGSVVEMTNYCDSPISSQQSKQDMFSVRCVRVDD